MFFFLFRLNLLMKISYIPNFKMFETGVQKLWPNCFFTTSKYALSKILYKINNVSKWSKHLFERKRLHQTFSKSRI